MGSTWVFVSFLYVFLSDNHFQYGRNMFSFPHRAEKEQGSGEEEASMHKDFFSFRGII